MSAMTHLLQGEIRRNLQARERERLELEIKYGLEPVKLLLFWQTF